MHFTTRRRRQAPTVIIISLIDILIVLLIFMMVTTTFKQHPAIRLALPESRQPKEGSSNDPGMVITIAKKEPFFYLNATPVTLSKLQEEITRQAAANPKLQIAIRGDADATLDHIIKVMDAAKAAKVKASISVFTKPAGK